MSDVTTSLRFNQSKMELELQKGLQTTISHDMKTPISSITQSVEMLLQGLVTDPKALQLLKPIQSAC
jgi:K+-sensing histidine kinase KdpD